MVEKAQSEKELFETMGLFLYNHIIYSIIHFIHFPFFLLDNNFLLIIIMIISFRVYTIECNPLFLVKKIKSDFNLFLSHLVIITSDSYLFVLKLLIIINALFILFITQIIFNCCSRNALLLF